MTFWAWLLIAFAAGSLLGAALTWLLVSRRPSEQRMRRMHLVLDRFEGDVAQHFQESGELITRLRSVAAQLYEHLERGAAKLTTEEAAQRRLRMLDDGEAEELDQDGETGPTTTR